MIIPLWNTQFRLPMMVSLLQDFPVILPPNTLALPFNQDQKYPRYPKMKLLAVHLSANPSDIQTFHQKLQILSWSCGYQPQGQDMSPHSEDCTALRYQGMRIPLLQMELLSWHFYLVCIVMVACIVGYVQHRVPYLVRLQLKAI